MCIQTIVHIIKRNRKKIKHTKSHQISLSVCPCAFCFHFQYLITCKMLTIYLENNKKKMKKKIHTTRNHYKKGDTKTFTKPYPIKRIKYVQQLMISHSSNSYIWMSRCYVLYANKNHVTFLCISKKKNVHIIYLFWLKLKK